MASAEASEEKTETLQFKDTLKKVLIGVPIG